MPLKLFLFLLLVPTLIHSLDPVLNEDVLGLIVFKAGLQDPEGKLSSWNEDDNNPCDWCGVKCNPRTNRVTELALDSFSLSGHIDKGLLKLQFLQILSLSRNNLTGTINPDIAHIGSLTIVDLSENSLSGPIPDEFFQQCGSLRRVSFAGNNITGQIPESLSSCFSLTAVNFSSNQLSGKLPSGIWYLRGLRLLDLSDNLLDGEIPQGIENLYDLRIISLRKNRFSGSLPENIGSCLHLKSVDFSENFLSGTLPESMQSLSSCSSLSLGGNSFSGEAPYWIGDLRNLEELDLSANNFSGQIPNSIGNLQLLQKLNLSINGFGGKLPESMANCINLLALDVSHNLLVGAIPSWIFKQDLRSASLFENKLTEGEDPWPTSTGTDSHGGLQFLDLSANGFSGELPSDIGVLSSLQVLNMSRNHFYGSIPKSIGELKVADVLDLSENRLNGSIPSEIGGAISLKELRLQKNFLSGKIPTQIEKCSSLQSLILSQNNFSGSVPVAIANLTNLQYVDFSLNVLSGSLPKELTNLSHLLYFNVSHNHLKGELPVGGFFNTISPSSVSGNPSLCGSVVNRTCPAVHPKPIVLNPNSSDSGGYSSRNHGHKKIILSISALIAIGAAAFIVLGVVAVTLLNIRVRSSMSRSAAPLALSGGEDFSCSPTNDPNYGKLVMFSGDADFDAGAQALLNKDSELGRGGFGVVYRTLLRDGRAVAIKKLTVSSLIKSQEDFEREVKNLGKIRHHNLVALEGYYWTPSLQLLIYEFIPSGSLYRRLHDAPVLCDMVRGALEEGRVEECVDEKLVRNFPADEAIPVVKLGLICASQVPSNRPDMSEVVNILELIQCPSEGQYELE
ncbi:hypothetical protein FEM48_Zijuj11G0124400 [Ziziphus jujuba var. spinosa]|uniref:Protein kinase domain-containing protein n=1 Tax=Ziziphus jujuba var. spinosa TaxID=714518 RepID=A0A978UIX6_ZIZJJ|nr:hypothetical protein FEM48_Zijuj11G0124400 [Ziziphus jujuba var. spinosa]